MSGYISQTKQVYEFHEKSVYLWDLYNLPPNEILHEFWYEKINLPITDYDLGFRGEKSWVAIRYPGVHENRLRFLTLRTWLKPLYDQILSGRIGLQEAHFQIRGAMQLYEIYLLLSGTNLGDKIRSAALTLKFIEFERKQVLDVSPETFFRFASEIPKVVLDEIHEKLLEAVPAWNDTFWEYYVGEKETIDGMLDVLIGGSNELNSN